MRILTLFFLLFSTCFLACEDDPCEDVACQNGGICQNGSCVCPDGYGGDDCAVALNPKTITIAVIRAERWPTNRADGTAWDGDGTAPDPVVVVTGPTGEVLGSTAVQNDAAPPASFSTAILITDPGEQTFSVTLYDDDVTERDSIGTYSWSASAYAKQTDFNNSVILDDPAQSTAFFLSVIYGF